MKINVKIFLLITEVKNGMFLKKLKKFHLLPIWSKIEKIVDNWAEELSVTSTL